MKFDGECHVDAPQEAVWAALFDPETLKRCVPGCESVTPLGEAGYDVTAVLKVGPVKARFAGRMELRDIDAPHACTIVAEGSGGAAGTAKGEARVTLVPQDGGTLVQYTSNATPAGKIAQLGSRLLDSTAKMMSRKFFAKLKDEVELSDEAA
ncbi:MAG: carbon monoxide dehydrogenase subunit G [Pseudomonadota bacterium]|nr:carbon monoxide dehydrogenase subunit G [Pseudomonadota bacterium]